MRILAQDCSVRDVGGRIVTAEVTVPWEDLAPGPTGHRVQLVDYDATTGKLYAPADGAREEDLAVPLDEAALARDPRLHARNAYALVMRTLGLFEFALGRRVSWCFRAHQLKVVPHAFEHMNAFYSREAEALLFGYFRRAGSPVFLCLSHDVVVHETTHALLDGLRSRFMAPSSPDQAAFHEAFADVVALLSVFTLGDVLELLITRDPLIGRGGVVRRDAVTAERLRESVLLGLAEEMAADAHAARVNALRRSVALEPSVRILHRPEFTEPHRRGEVLVAAVMRAFVDAWVGRLNVPEAAATDDIDVRRVVEEGADVARTLLTMAIRGIDYTPPIHLEFGDFLSAMITADAEVRTDDTRYGLRAGLLHWFGRYGIKPASHRRDGLWRASRLQLASEGVRFGSLQTDPVEMFRLVWANRDRLHLSPAAYMRIASLRPCVRISPDDGLPLRETVAECLQFVQIHASELGQYGLVPPPGMPPETPIALEGGSTLILDEYGRLKYEVHNRLPDPARERDVQRAQGRLDYLWAQGHFDKGASFAARLATMHRLRAVERQPPRAEVW